MQVDPPQLVDKVPADASADDTSLPPPGDEDKAAESAPVAGAPEEGDAEPEAADAEQQVPRCPNCGWRNVRKSHSNGLVDTLMRMFSVVPFRCRSCGLRFHRRWVTKQAKEDE